MTETNMNTSNPYDGDRIAGTVGHPLPGVSVRIADREPARLPRDEIGMIEVKGPNVFKGYWRMPEKTGPNSATTASSSPATSARSTPTDTCASSAAART